MELTNFNKDRKQRRKNNVDLSTMMYGKVPPQARELEEAVLGAVMLDKAAFDVVAEILKAECFYVDAHQRIFKAYHSLVQKNLPIDILTVMEELRSKEELDMVGGPYFLTKLTNAVVSTANIEAHSRIVLQKFIQRELIRVSGEILGEAYEEGTDVFDLMDDAEDKIFKITNNFLKTDYKEMSSALAEAINRIDEMRNRTEEISGVPSGFPTMDRVTYGWQPSDLIILAARPAVGKTAFALNLARNAAMNTTRPTAVAFFSLEMSAAQLVQRILSAESEIGMEKISRGKLEDYEYQQLHAKGIKRLEKAAIFIDDSAGLNIFEFRAKARRLVNKNKVRFIIIDYLQLMSGGGNSGSREQEISTISRTLKMLAKELMVPIIALSQLSRAVETRKESKMPQLSDLRESGAIEQDADMVMFIYRPEYYEINNDAMGESTKGETHVRIAKHRNGSLETIKLRANLAIQKFHEWDEDDMGGGFNPGGGAGGGAPNGGGGWKPLGPSSGGAPDGGGGDGGKFFIQGSRMNSGEFDDGMESDAPF
ncbi:primary replicative DNA helicase [Filimonas lacunae]|uniref:Replicative DNA helicase n=1 Tax=Filimonas lacunae TaxID=477680 RepID=A0A173MR59_9BACT|nr:replicative DNA helicase [Filimonas lacunae]BAV10144.1 replicative DNA helicase [Filimonas lacunae]SIT18880.1 primary replicative DNA helicase [Filimonas lacunae]